MIKIYDSGTTSSIWVYFVKVTTTASGTEPKPTDLKTTGAGQG